MRSNTSLAKRARSACLAGTWAALQLACALPVAAADCGGTATVEVSRRSVKVSGDDLDNCIEVSAGAGTLEILGQGDTTVALGAGTPLPALDELATVVVRLGSGDDRIEVNDVDAPASRWAIKAGDGADFLGVGRVSARTFRMDGGADDDTLVASLVTVEARLLVKGGGGIGDNLVLEGALDGRMAIASVESHERPRLACPIAESTAEGSVLLGLAELEVVSCDVPPTDGTETHLRASLEATSLETGEDLVYRVRLKTPVGLTQAPLAATNDHAWIENRSGGEDPVPEWSHPSVPAYRLAGFEACRELVAAACPDHLNSALHQTDGDSGGPINDVGPGDDFNPG